MPQYKLSYFSAYFGADKIPITS